MGLLSPRRRLYEGYSQITRHSVTINPTSGEAAKSQEVEDAERAKWAGLLSGRDRQRRRGREGMMGTHYPIQVANAFIDLAGDAGVSHMKLQKLVYLTLEDWLRSHESSFLIGAPEVWQYGPVFPDLYHALKSYKSEEIKSLINPFGVAPTVTDPNVMESIQRVWDQYKYSPATRLSDLTHRHGGPWFQIAERYNFKVPYGTSIPEDVIKRYVRQEAKAVA